MSITAPAQHEWPSGPTCHLTVGIDCDHKSTAHSSHKCHMKGPWRRPSDETLAEPLMPATHVGVYGCQGVHGCEEQLSDACCVVLRHRQVQWHMQVTCRGELAGSDAIRCAAAEYVSMWHVRCSVRAHSDGTQSCTVMTPWMTTWISGTYILQLRENFLADSRAFTLHTWCVP